MKKDEKTKRLRIRCIFAREETVCHRQKGGRAILSISCCQKEQDIIFKVMDNGSGMSEEQYIQILTKDSKGYGVKNVHQRIQLTESHVGDMKNHASHMA